MKIKNWSTFKHTSSMLGNTAKLSIQYKEEKARKKQLQQQQQHQQQMKNKRISPTRLQFQ